MSVAEAASGWVILEGREGREGRSQTCDVTRNESHTPSLRSFAPAASFRIERVSTQYREEGPTSMPAEPKPLTTTAPDPFPENHQRRPQASEPAPQVLCHRCWATPILGFFTTRAALALCHICHYYEPSQVPPLPWGKMPTMTRNGIWNPNRDVGRDIRRSASD
jgi:hypothetical protein